MWTYNPLKVAPVACMAFNEFLKFRWWHFITTRLGSVCVHSVHVFFVCWSFCWVVWFSPTLQRQVR